ncbi:hypothetical protein HMPREF0653_00777 [Prevotella disiens JCM 6334 = ATCC 29426]|uniref:Uncharacterized protein n=1 Tax=Prevotella disiens JCM 6334 = ATCC 29426 TaxID=1235811 RepID=A0ABP2Y988_9BACT|nr:hypothetical protein HMPREF0653_00777 [Prevotella disiens JCM 6334 = ATCC 29426]
MTELSLRACSFHFQSAKILKTFFISKPRLVFLLFTPYYKGKYSILFSNKKSEIAILKIEKTNKNA